MNDVTRILSAIEQGDRQAADRLLPLVYDELRKLAAARMAAEKPGHTLDATALVHEAYLRMVGDQHFDGRGHFFAAAARQCGVSWSRTPGIGSGPEASGRAERRDLELLDQAAPSPCPRIPTSFCPWTSPAGAARSRGRCRPRPRR